MCTAIRFDERFFGRTLDFERSFGEELLVTPRGVMRIGESENRYAIMGIGVKNGATSLYFDAINEWGLVSAALNFPGRAVYHKPSSDMRGVPSGHLIALVLGLCRSVSEARDMLEKICITDEGAAKDMPPTPLHWLIADQRESIVVESVEEGLKIYNNPVGVLTNSPEFPYQMTRLADFSNLRASNPEPPNPHAPLYSRGMGAIGLPGDFSSTSRFVRAEFVKRNTSSEIGEIGRIFRILDSVSVPLGCIVTDEGRAVSTLYSVCADMEDSSYYLTTASCRAIRKISLTDTMMLSHEIITIPIYREEYILPI